jgi:putative spermidine/putrescine transport system ATP-binding protein
VQTDAALLDVDRPERTLGVGGASPILEVRGLIRRYGNLTALDGVDLAVMPGEFIALLGPSGSGKTTMLNLVAGLIAPTAGRILINGVDATAVPPSRRGLGMVFQNYALMPHMNVFENVAFPLQVRRLPRRQIERKVMDALELVQIADLRLRRPRELSGGQQQRVAIARCIVYSPTLILMDEPLGALDKRLREQMQLELKKLHDKLRMTILYVTHDQQEALTMADRIVLMHRGRVEQVGTPAELYASPVSIFAAEFVGDSNIMSGTVLDSGVLDSIRLDRGEVVHAKPRRGIAVGQRVKVMIRPENVSIRGAPPAGADRVRGTVQSSIILGNVVRHHVRLSDGSAMTCTELNRPHHPTPTVGTAVELWWRPEDAVDLKANTEG